MSERAAALLEAGQAPARWAGRERFTVLVVGEAGIDVFLSAWSAWRRDPRRCARLEVIVVGAALRDAVAVRDASIAPALRALLQAAWPPLTPDLHRLAFEEGRVNLLLGPDDAGRTLRDLVASVDLFLIDTHRDDSPFLSGEPRHAKAIARLAASDATLAAASLDTAAEQALMAVGFRFEDTAAAPDLPSLRRARFAPRFLPRRAVRDSARPPAGAHALIIGGGLAGCATACALAECGWDSTLIERRASIADEASGNPAGLFHGIVNGQDGSHARFNRAAALEAHVAATIAIRRHRVAGALDGLLQLVDADMQVDAMHALLGRLRLPPDYVQALGAEAASARAGLPIERPAWFYPGGGWIAPRGLARSFVERAGMRVTMRTSTSVAALERADGLWHLLDAAGQRFASAAVVVLAGGGECLRLIGAEWPVEAVRGQISSIPVAAFRESRLPRLPLTGAGFLMPDVDGRAIFGATADAGDSGVDVRPADHDRNRHQLLRLVPALRSATLAGGDDLDGRAGTRWVSRDRLPLIGQVPCQLDGSRVSGHPQASRADTPRRVERQDGLYVFTALGSRGITWAALGGRIIAASISGSPLPVGSRLLDAIDPARFAVRERQRPER
jgi:tRNA 5-methylaminomethyl-2-thiouridine biosynthesis bifunctional protein